MQTLLLPKLLDAQMKLENWVKPSQDYAKSLALYNDCCQQLDETLNRIFLILPGVKKNESIEKYKDQILISVGYGIEALIKDDNSKF